MNFAILLRAEKRDAKESLSKGGSWMSEKERSLHFLPGAEWMTRHEREHHLISSGSNRRMKQDALFSGYTPTADLTAKASYCPGKVSFSSPEEKSSSGSMPS